MAQEFDVNAKVNLLPGKGQGTLKQAKKDTKDLRQELAAATTAAGSLWGRMLAIGGAYVGLGAGINMVSQLTRSTVQYTASLERMGVGLTTVLAAVEGLNWEQATKRSQLAFEFLKEAAVISPAGPQELFSIFQGIVGPIESAGFSMQKVLDITMDTVSAASALNVDFAQAQRDISLMVRGAAGMDVKLFSLLRSMNLITESTEDWNKKLTAEDRVTKLSEALSEFGQAGDKYAKSFSGVNATFRGIVDELGRAAFSPVMDTIAVKLDKLNDYLIENRGQIESTLRTMGESAANALSKVIDSSVTAFNFVTNNWSDIIKKIDETVGKLQSLAPVMALAYGGHKLVGMSGGYGAVGSAMLSGGGAAAGVPAKTAEGMLASGFSQGQDGKWGDSAGKFVSAGGAAAGAGAAGSGIGATLSAAMGPISVALTGVAMVAAFASDHFQAFQQIWSNATTGIGSDLMDLWTAIKEALLPLLKNWGGAISMVLVPAFQVLVFVFRLLVKGLTLVINVFGAIYSWIYDKLSPMFTFVLDLFVGFGEALQKLASILGFETQKIRDLAKADDPEKAKYEGDFNDWVARGHRGLSLFGGTDPDMAKQAELLRTPGARSTTQVNNDFRGSKISVKQDFKGRHDPDRIVQAMMTDLTRQAEMRISSGYVSALTR